MRKKFLFNLILLFSAIAASFVGGYFVFGERDVYPAEAQITDKEPPIIFNSRVQELKATSCTIIWQTDEDADSLVNYGLNKNYGMARDPFFDKINHKIVLDDLLPDTTYFFRLISTDKSGNQSISNDFTFITAAVEKKKEESEKKGDYPGPSEEPGQYPGPSAEEIKTEEMTKILEMVEQIQQEKILEIIERQIQQKAQEISEPLTIIFDKVDVEVGIDNAIIRWRTNKESNSLVSLAEERSFSSGSNNPYTWEEGKFDEAVVDHLVAINGLSPATTYHFRVTSENSLGLRAQSDYKVFTTKSVLPEIYNISIAKIEEDAATITFVTNVPCSSLTEYTDLSTNETKMSGNSSYTTIHSVRLSNLMFDTYYSAIITVENEYGEEAESAPIVFLTIKDEVPPVISKIKTESTLYPGSDNKIQTIVSWETDEPSVCQLFYHQGISTTKDPEKLPLEKDYGAKHVQVTTNLVPATVYKFWIECFDDIANKVTSNNFIMLTPTREQSIIDIILSNFESTFGWVKGKK